MKQINDLPTNLFELKRLSGLAYGIVPKTKKKHTVTIPEINSLNQLLVEIRTVSEECLVQLLNMDGTELTQTEQDVVDSYIRLGGESSNAEQSVRDARKDYPMADFDTLFRVCLSSGLHRRA